MKLVRLATETEVVASFAESEFSSPRHREAIATWIPSNSARARILTTHPTRWNGADRADAMEATRRYREPILGGLFTLKPSWHVAEITPDELPLLRPLDYPPFNALAPDRRLGTLVEAMDAGRDTPGDTFSIGYRRLRGEYRAEEVRGLPAVAGRTEAGPYIVFDGLTRLSVLRHRSISGETVPAAIPLFLAVTARIASWKWAGL